MFIQAGICISNMICNMNLLRKGYTHGYLTQLTVLTSIQVLLLGKKVTFEYTSAKILPSFNFAGGRLEIVNGLVRSEILSID